jgi:N-acetylmuramoyl-L-alanine amidase CwlA
MSEIPDTAIFCKTYSNFHSRHLPQALYIHIHYTAGGSSKPGSALGVRKVFLKRKASADFAVDDRDIVQINPDLRNFYCWSVGDKKNPYSSGGRLYGKATNRNTISIEICSNLEPGTSASAANHAGWYFTNSAIDNALRLVRWLMKKFDVPKERVVRHYDISGKVCPGVIGWNDEYIYSVKGERSDHKSTSMNWNYFWNKI